MNTPVFIPSGNYISTPEVAAQHPDWPRTTITSWLRSGHLTGVKTGIGWLIEAGQLATFKPVKYSRQALPGHITIAKVSALCGWPRSTVTYWVKNGYLIGTKVRGSWVVEVSQLADFKPPKRGTRKRKLSTEKADLSTG